MSEDRLTGFWRATEAPGRDIAFALAVEERIARRRMQFELAGSLAAASALLAALSVLWPVVLSRANTLVSSLDVAGPALAAAAVMGGAMVWLNRRPAES